MSAETFITLWCDYAGCDEFIESGRTTTTDARRQAKSERWRYLGVGRDYCPKHPKVVAS